MGIEVVGNRRQSYANNTTGDLPVARYVAQIGLARFLGGGTPCLLDTWCFDIYCVGTADAVVAELLGMLARGIIYSAIAICLRIHFAAKIRCAEENSIESLTTPPHVSLYICQESKQEKIYI